MQRSLVPTLFALPVCVLLLSAPPAHAQLKSPLRLGAPIPASLDNADKHEKRCHTSDTQVDPCTEVKIGSIRCTIAWDEQTKAITYLFTDDRSLVTLRVSATDPLNLVGILIPGPRVPAHSGNWIVLRDGALDAPIELASASAP